MQAKLLVTKDGTVVRELKLKPTTTVGRSTDSDLCIRSSLVSRDHCVVFEHQGTLVVKDLGSTNGTFVNGSSVTEQVLSPGDELTIGQVHFRVQYEPAKGAMLAPRAAKPAPAVAAAVFDPDDSTILEAEAVDVGEAEVLEAEVVDEDDDEALEAIEAVPVDVLDEVDDADFLDAEPVESPSGAGSARGSRALDDDDDDDDLDEFLSRLGQH